MVNCLAYTLQGSSYICGPSYQYTKLTVKLRDSFAAQIVTLQKRIIIRNPHKYIVSTKNKQDVLKRFVENTELFYFSGLSFKDTPRAGGRVLHDEWASVWTGASFFNASLYSTTRTVNRILSVILFEVIRTCVLLKLEICSICARFEKTATVCHPVFRSTRGERILIPSFPRVYVPRFSAMPDDFRVWTPSWTGCVHAQIAPI